jgi:hypothetical protein
MSSEIMTANVRELVKQNGMPPILRPVVAVSRENNCRIQNSTCERHLRVFASEQTRRLIDAEAIGHFI